MVQYTFKLITTIMVGLIIGIVSAQRVRAQEKQDESGGLLDTQLNYFYVHGSAGVGMCVLSSSDIEKSLPEDFSVTNLGFPLYYNFRAGFLNIIQLEYRKLTTSDHSIGKLGFTGNGSTGIGRVAETEMDYKSKEQLIKFNPLFWLQSGNRAIFLIFGTSKVSYLDGLNEGWNGSGSIYGIEWAVVSPYISLSIGATYHDIHFDTYRISNITVMKNFNANQLLFYIEVGLGLGY
jgi:hypothetical protein